MKNKILTAASVLFAVFTFSQKDEYETMPYIKGEILLMVDDNINIQEVVETNRTINGIFTELALVKAVSEPTNIWLLKFNDDNISHPRMIDALYETSHVVIAQNNHKVQERVTIPNDTYYGSMWHHNDGPSDNDIDSELAWDITTGGQTDNGDDIVVCVLEGGGAVWNHPDLIANHWVNTNEIPNNNYDDDGNGYVDDYDGWNLAGNDNIGAGSHGTGVSSMIGATGNNSLGVVGANWDVKIMQVDMAGALTESNVIAAYTYPLVMRKKYTSSGGSNGALVVATNASWGIDNGNAASVPLWCAFYDTLGYHGILNLGATTNSNVNVDVVGDIPTSCTSDYMISVTATNNNDVRTFSGYGQTTIDLGAPGESVAMAYPSQYIFNDGTSFATPLTAGVVALMYSVPCNNLADMAMTDPKGAADIIRAALLDGVDLVPNLTNETVTGGRLNAYNSVLTIQTDCGTYSSSCTGIFSGAESPATCYGDCTGEIDISASGGSGSYTYDIGNGDQAGSNFSGLCSGIYTVSVDDGMYCQVDVVVTVNEPSAVSATPSNSDVECNGAATGVIQLTAAGGTPPFQYSIDNGVTFQSSGTFPGLAAGVYNVVVQDNMGCNFSTTAGINEPSAVSATPSNSDVECNGAATGVIQLTAAGGTPPFQYSIDNGVTFQGSGTFPGLAAGAYNVVVQDNMGCNFSTTAGINEPSALTMSSTPAIEIFGNDGSIDLTVSGGTPPYGYSWTGPNGFTSTVEDPSGLISGTYNVTVTDANGCTMPSGNIYVESTVGIDLNEFDFSIYPNPARDEVIISLPNSEEVNMILVDNAGRIIQRQKLINENNSINLSKIASGIYLLKLTTNQGLVSTDKLIIE